MIVLDIIGWLGFFIVADLVRQHVLKWGIKSFKDLLMYALMAILFGLSSQASQSVIKELKTYTVSVEKTQ